MKTGYKKAILVIGAGFGDEGKGLATDYFCRKNEEPLVIRFNGGHQAGHTVVDPNGFRHVFSNFGAGTLAGAPTYWSKYCTVSPGSIVEEHKALVSYYPKLYIDNLCPVVTHYDVYYNRLSEQKNQHGSCGLGFGATVKRHTETPYKLFAGDLVYPFVVEQKLKSIRQHYEQLGSVHATSYDYDTEDKRFFEAINAFKPLVTFVSEEDIMSSDFFNFSTYIFEGAQGILLDMDHGFFPHVTRSNTTSKNAMKIINRRLKKVLKDRNIETYYITRCYQTRHGNGPMSNESKPIDLKNNEEETNVFNAFQGQFKTGILDLDLLHYAVNIDKLYSSNLIHKNLFITCLDQIVSPYSNTPILMTEKGEKIYKDYLQIAKQLKLNKDRGLNECTLFSFGPTSRTVKKYSQVLVDL